MRGRVRGLGHHERYVELVQTLSGHRQADQAPAVRRHEIDGVWRDLFRGDHQVTFVLPILVIDNNDEPAILDINEGFFNICECHSQSRCSIRSTYFAMMSNSRFTRSPGLACRRFVFSNVCGMIAISNSGALTAATVRLMPSKAMEPFSTI